MKSPRPSVTDVNSKACLFTTIYLGVVGVCVFVVQPIFNQGLVTSIGLTPQQVGYVTSAEMWGMAATTIAFTVLAGRVSWRKMTAGSLLVAVIGNLATIGHTDVTVLMVARAVSGIGLGALITLPFLIMGLTRNPDRNMAWIVTFVLIYGALCSYAMPWAIEKYSLTVVLAFFAAFIAVGIPLVRFIPDTATAPSAETGGAAPFTSTIKTLTVLAVFFFGVAVTAVWAYAVLVGTNGGLEEQTAGTLFGNSQFIGILGAFLAVMLANKYGRIVPMSVGILGCAAGAAVLLADMTYLTYSIAIYMFSLCWNFVQPYLMALQMVAYAIGPYVGARLVQTGERHLYDTVNLTGALTFVLSWLVIIPGLVSQRRAALAGSGNRYQPSERPL
jgi:MFS family permease